VHDGRRAVDQETGIVGGQLRLLVVLARERSHRRQ